MSIPAYPLQWPTGWPRTKSADRRNAQFRAKGGTHGCLSSANLTVAKTVERIREELRLMGVSDDDCVISTNIPLRLDGLPRSGQGEPDDSGVAVYWRDAFNLTLPRCMAIDLYTTVAGNLAAVAATLNALRAVERHGGAQILDRAFAGFAALPGPADRDCWAILGIPRDSSPDRIQAAYRNLARTAHPDAGGSDAQMAELNRARDEAMRS